MHSKAETPHAMVYKYAVNVLILKSAEKYE